MKNMEIKPMQLILNTAVFKVQFSKKLAVDNCSDSSLSVGKKLFKCSKIRALWDAIMTQHIQIRPVC